LLLEQQEVAEVKPELPFRSITRPTWKETRTKLEKQSLLRKREDEKMASGE